MNLISVSVGAFSPDCITLMTPPFNTALLPTKEVLVIVAVAEFSIMNVPPLRASF